MIRFRKNGISAIAALVVVMAWANAAGAATNLVVFVRDQPTDFPDPVIEEFERRNPDLKIELVRASASQMDDKFLVMTATQVPVDVVISMSLVGWASYGAKGLFRDLTPYIERDGEKLRAKGVPDFVLGALRTVGGITSIPYSIYASYIMVYNATYFDEAGLAGPAADWDDRSWTWAAMVEAAKKLVRYNSEGQMTRAGLLIGADDISTQSLSLMWGGDLFAPSTYEDGIVRELTFLTPENIRAFSEAAALSTEHRVTQHVQPQLPGIQISLPRGTAAMEFQAGGSIGHNWAGDYRWGMAPAPLTPVLERRVPLPVWVRAAAIHSGSQHPDAAWRLIKFLLTDAYELGEFQVAGEPAAWNVSRGITPTAWQRFVEIMGRSLNFANPPDQLVGFLVRGVGEYARIAASNLLVGGGDTIHYPNGPLYRWTLAAYRGEVPVEQALAEAEREANALLERILQELME